MTSFVRVREILDSAIAEWAVQHERPPNLRRHGMQFGWRTKTELLDSAGQSFWYVPSLVRRHEGGLNAESQADIGRPNCLRFVNKAQEPFTVAYPGAFDDQSKTIYFQTDFLWSLPFRAFSTVIRRGVQPLSCSTSVR